MKIIFRKIKMILDERKKSKHVYMYEKYVFVKGHTYNLHTTYVVCHPCISQESIYRHRGNFLASATVYRLGKQDHS